MTGEKMVQIDAKQNRPPARPRSSWYSWSISRGQVMACDPGGFEHIGALDPVNLASRWPKWCRTTLACDHFDRWLGR